MAPITLEPLQVEIKDTWADDWVIVPNVEPLGASINAATVGEFRFRVRYGDVKFPGQSDFGPNPPTQTARQWVRCMRSPYVEANDILWQGRIEADTRQLFGPDNGLQTFSAWDGVQILDKIIINKSFAVQEQATEVEVSQVLPFNHRDGALQRTDNRSVSKFVNRHLFEGDASFAEAWTVENAVEYLVRSFLFETNGPVWGITGETITDELEPLEMPGMLTALEFLNIILNQKVSGYSFVVLPTVDGFDLNIFSMAVDEITFGTVTIPANPNSVTINNATNPEKHLAGTAAGRGSDNARYVEWASHVWFGPNPNGDSGWVALSTVSRLVGVAIGFRASSFVRPRSSPSNPDS